MATKSLFPKKHLAAFAFLVFPVALTLAYHYAGTVKPKSTFMATLTHEILRKDAILIRSKFSSWNWQEISKQDRQAVHLLGLNHLNSIIKNTLHCDIVDRVLIKHFNTVFDANCRFHIKQGQTKNICFTNHANGRNFALNAYARIILQNAWNLLMLDTQSLNASLDAYQKLQNPKLGLMVEQLQQINGAGIDKNEGQCLKILAAIHIAAKLMIENTPTAPNKHLHQETLNC